MRTHSPFRFSDPVYTFWEKIGWNNTQQKNVGAAHDTHLGIEQIDLGLPSLDETFQALPVRVYVLLHLVGGFGKLVRVEVGG